MNSQYDQPTMTWRCHQAYGWTVSAFIHLCGIGGALMLMAELERPALSQSPRIDIALVQPNAVEAVSEPVSADIPSPLPARMPPPAPTPPRPIERRVQARPIVAAAQEIPRVTRDIMTAPAPVDAHPAEGKPAPSVRSVHEMEQPITQTAQESRTTETRQVVTQSPALEQDSKSEPMPSMPVNLMEMKRPEPVETDKTVEKEGRIEQPHAIERAEVVTHESPQHMPMASGVEHRSVTERAVHTLAETHADYGWLAESLWKRIEQLKHYPTKARTRHWEGKVILEAVIRDDGTIMELRIEESSGHAILDQDALAVVKKASPLALKHALGQPQITILVPITYDLDS